MSRLRDVLESGKGNEKLNQHKDVKCSPKTRKVQLTWLHFDDKKHTLSLWELLRKVEQREVDVKLNAGKNDVIDVAKAMIFPHSKSIFGSGQFPTWNWTIEENHKQMKIRWRCLFLICYSFFCRYSWKLQNIKMAIRTKINFELQKKAIQ